MQPMIRLIISNISCLRGEIVRQATDWLWSVLWGVFQMKVKDEIVLRDWVHKIIIPTELKEKLESCIPDDLQDRVLYIENDCKDILDWSEKVYGVVERG